MKPLKITLLGMYFLIVGAIMEFGAKLNVMADIHLSPEHTQLKLLLGIALGILGAFVCFYGLWKLDM